jgi:hypothetical protein
VGPLLLKMLSADSYTELRFSRASHKTTTSTSSLEGMMRQTAVDGGSTATADGSGNGGGNGIKRRGGGDY